MQLRMRPQHRLYVVTDSRARGQVARQLSIQLERDLTVPKTTRQNEMLSCEDAAIVQDPLSPFYSHHRERRR